MARKHKLSSEVHFGVDGRSRGAWHQPAHGQTDRDDVCVAEAVRRRAVMLLCGLEKVDGLAQFTQTAFDRLRKRAREAAGHVQ
jgi:hypothetical protein